VGDILHRRERQQYIRVDDERDEHSSMPKER